MPEDTPTSCSSRKWPWTVAKDMHSASRLVQVLITAVIDPPCLAALMVLCHVSEQIRCKFLRGKGGIADSGLPEYTYPFDRGNTIG